MLLRLELERLAARADGELRTCPRCEATTFDRRCLCSPHEPLDDIEKLDSLEGEALQREFERMLREAGGGRALEAARAAQPDAVRDDERERPDGADDEEVGG